MAHNNVTTARLPLRSRIGAQRVKADENATSRHLRQPSNLAGVSRFAHSVATGFKSVNTARPALGEVTTTAVNRKSQDGASKLAGKEKEKEVETGHKRSRSSSLAAATGPQRVPLGPGRPQPSVPVANPVRSSLIRGTRPLIPHARRISRVISSKPVPAVSSPVLRPVQHELDVEADVENVMDIVNSDGPAIQDDVEESLLEVEQEVEAMIGVDTSDEEVEETARVVAKPPRVWPDVSTERATRYRQEVNAIREAFEDEVDMFDTTMVSEYSEEIFEYMLELQEDMMPSGDYMTGQHEINWTMRQTLVDWLTQVHLRYHMLPETLWIAVNIVDRFLTRRVVSVVKLQLVGITAMFIAAKYEEILAPAVDEFVFMTENGYTKEEILKGERIVLQTLDFKISHYCSPYSWMRKISKADDYDIQTRTLSKFLTEVTLLDHNFLPVKPSLVAAVGMYCARKMLGGDWNDAFVFYSEYAEEQLIPGLYLLVQKLCEDGFSKQCVCKKYAHKKFLKASVFAIEWARTQVKAGLVELPE